MGREGIEPPVSIEGWPRREIQPDSCAPWRDRPMVAGTGCGAGPGDNEVSSDAVVKVRLAELDARRVGRPGRIRTLGRRFWRPRRHLGSSLCEQRHPIEPRMTECADVRAGLERKPEGSATSSCRDCRLRPRGAGCPRSDSPRTPAGLEDAIGRTGTRACRGRRGRNPAASARWKVCVP